MNITLCPIDTIIVADRQRTTFHDSSGLRDSIKQHGLLHPLVVNRQLHLISGERRLRVCKELEWKEIPVHFLDELDEVEAAEIEMEAKLHRANLSDEEKEKS